MIIRNLTGAKGSFINLLPTSKCFCPISIHVACFLPYIFTCGFEVSSLGPLQPARVSRRGRSVRRAYRSQTQVTIKVKNGATARRAWCLCEGCGRGVYCCPDALYPRHGVALFLIRRNPTRWQTQFGLQYDFRGKYVNSCQDERKFLGMGCVMCFCVFFFFFCRNNWRKHLRKYLSLPIAIRFCDPLHPSTGACDPACDPSTGACDPPVIRLPTPVTRLRSVHRRLRSVHRRL